MPAQVEMPVVAERSYGIGWKVDALGLNSACAAVLRNALGEAADSPHDVVLRNAFGEVASDVILCAALGRHAAGAEDDYDVDDPFCAEKPAKLGVAAPHDINGAPQYSKGWQRVGEIAKDALMFILVPPQTTAPICEFSFAEERGETAAEPENEVERPAAAPAKAAPPPGPAPRLLGRPSALDDESDGP
uniref:Uncharacterized protein n=1 Tax=Alexandrium catenella TaxID=2925 RepID=A0A7S1MTY9_ALECA